MDKDDGTLCLSPLANNEKISKNNVVLIIIKAMKPNSFMEPFFRRRDQSELTPVSSDPLKVAKTHAYAMHSSTISFRGESISRDYTVAITLRILLIEPIHFP